MSRSPRSAGARVIDGADDFLEVEVGRLLTARGETVATAESCTGGLVSERLTRVPGSSAYFIESRVTYADRAKTSSLGVPVSVLKEHGAVSAACARLMAAGMRARAKTDWALSVTGIAGPGGGTARKPVGLVYIGLAGTRGARAWKHRFSGGRARVREQSAQRALDYLRRALISSRNARASG